MAHWKIEPSWKKSIIERMYFSKDNNTLVVETGWRWGSFECETEDENIPNIESGTDLWSCDHEVELIETWDGCWEDYEYDGMTDEEIEDIDAQIDEENQSATPQTDQMGNPLPFDSTGNPLPTAPAGVPGQAGMDPNAMMQQQLSPPKFAVGANDIEMGS